MIDILDFKQARHANSWRRVNVKHPLDIYIGMDVAGRYAFEYTGRFHINKSIRSSSLIELTHYKQKDDRISMVLSLTDHKYLRQFCTFCNDIVNSTNTLKSEDISEYETICNILVAWQKMFRVQTTLLSENEIKGLIGELLFLRNELIPIYGVSRAISAWTGPDATKKDFSINETWYEIKTIDNARNSVRISSIEQLESDVTGQLIIYRMEKMASEFSGITINSLVESLMLIIDLFTDKELFMEKLAHTRYRFDPLYDSYVYDVKSIDRFWVSTDFPRLKRKNLHKAINSATYELTISELSDYKV